jgi:hypothetical protein
VPSGSQLGKTGLLAWMDKNNDGIITYRAGAPFKASPYSAAKPANTVSG